ncbi:MAG: carbohydrate binding domain-containing protein [Bacteroidaceae bacterium]|nr:carbohydrate binding domain-containing protein [Bacteroidaceae bacterium]
MKKTFKTFALMLLTAFAFSSCVDVPAPYGLPEKDSNTEGGTTGTKVEPKGDGTAASPFNVAAAVAKIKEMEPGVESTEEYYIKGKVLAVTTTAETIKQYGNHTFTMVDEGDNSTVFTAFQVYGPGKQKFTAVDDIKAGDEVVVCGRVVNFKGTTPETVGKGAAYVVSINASGDGGSSEEDVNVEPKGDGTAASPFNVAAIVAEIKKMEAGVESTKEYYIKGKVLAVTTTAETIKQYGNHTFTMVDEGNNSTVFTAFQVYGPNKQKFTSVDDIKAGYEVVVCGKVVNYKGTTPETVGKGAAYVVSINSEGGSGGQGGDGGNIQHITIAEFLAKADTETTYELTGTVKNISNTTFGNFDLEEDGSSIYIYGLLDKNGASRQFASLGIAEGDIVTLTGKYFLYQDKPEIKDAQFVSVTKGSGDGGDGGDGGEGGDPVTDLVNGDFESWVSDTEATGWKSASTASNAEVSKSIEAHSGNYACRIAAGGTYNKRLATQEMQLEAGTYTISYYAKSTTSDVCQTRTGYATVANPQNPVYNYFGYTTINNQDWTFVTFEFTLTDKTELCLFVTNPKSNSYNVSQDILVDDATLVKH